MTAIGDSFPKMARPGLRTVFPDCLSLFLRSLFLGKTVPLSAFLSPLKKGGNLLDCHPKFTMLETPWSYL